MDERPAYQRRPTTTGRSFGDAIPDRPDGGAWLRRHVPPEVGRPVAPAVVIVAVMLVLLSAVALAMTTR